MDVIEDPGATDKVRPDHLRLLTIFMSFQYYAHKSGQKIPVRYLVLHRGLHSNSVNSLYWSVLFGTLRRSDRDLRGHRDADIPIYRVIKGL